MKTLRSDIIIFLGLLALTLVILLLTIGQSAIDIQLHDTYIVLDKLSIVILILGPLTFLIFLSRGLTRKFITRGTNIGLIVGLILVASIIYRVARLQESYLSEIMKLDKEFLPDKEKFALAAETKINWTWALFALFSMGFIALTYRTFKIWNGRNDSDFDAGGIEESKRN